MAVLSISDYDLGQALGTGGFATVYRARDRATGCEVAIKVIIKSHMIERNLVDKVDSEIKIHRILKHDHIVKLLGCMEDDLNIYLVLELCKKGNLYSYLQRHGPLAESDAFGVIRQLISAVEYLHSKKIIHRDLKLSNILLTGEVITGTTHPEVKLCDFGLATRVAHPDDECNTVCGTPNYIPPEIAANRSHSFPADMWSVGCLFYTLVVGRPPFERQNRDDTYENIRYGQYDIPHNKFSEFGLKFLQSMLDKDQRTRASVRQALEHPLVSPRASPVPTPTSRVRQSAALEESSASLPSPTAGERSSSQNQCNLSSNVQHRAELNKPHSSAECSLRRSGHSKSKEAQRADAAHRQLQESREEAKQWHFEYSPQHHHHQQHHQQAHTTCPVVTNSRQAEIESGENGEEPHHTGYVPDSCGTHRSSMQQGLCTVDEHSMRNPTQRYQPPQQHGQWRQSPQGEVAMPTRRVAAAAVNLHQAHFKYVLPVESPCAEPGNGSSSGGGANASIATASTATALVSYPHTYTPVPGLLRTRLPTPALSQQSKHAAVQSTAVQAGASKQFPSTILPHARVATSLPPPTPSSSEPTTPTDRTHAHSAHRGTSTASSNALSSSAEKAAAVYADWVNASTHVGLLRKSQEGNIVWDDRTDSRAQQLRNSTQGQRRHSEVVVAAPPSNRSSIGVWPQDSVGQSALQAERDASSRYAEPAVNTSQASVRSSASWLRSLDGVRAHGDSKNVAVHYSTHRDTPRIAPEGVQHVQSSYPDWSTQYAYAKHVAHPVPALPSPPRHNQHQHSQPLLRGADAPLTLAQALSGVQKELLDLPSLCFTTQLGELLVVVPDDRAHQLVLVTTLDVHSTTKNRNGVHSPGTNKARIRVVLSTSPDSKSKVVLGQVTTDMLQEASHLEQEILLQAGRGTQERLVEDLHIGSKLDTAASAGDGEWKNSSPQLSDSRKEHTHKSKGSGIKRLLQCNEDTVGDIALQKLTLLSGSGNVRVFDASRATDTDAPAVLVQILQRVSMLLEAAKRRLAGRLFYFFVTSPGTASKTVHLKCMFMRSGRYPDFFVQWTDQASVRYEVSRNHIHLDLGPRALVPLRWTGDMSCLDISINTSLRTSSQDLWKGLTRLEEAMPEHFIKYAREAMRAFRKCKQHCAGEHAGVVKTSPSSSHSASVWLSWE